MNDVNPYNHFEMYKQISANIIVKDTTSKSSDKTDNPDDSLGRNVRLFNKARKEVYKRGFISLDAVMEITHSLNAEGLRVQEVNEIAKSIYRFISRRFLEHERGDPERARFQIEYRWLKHQRSQGERLADAAKRFGVSKSTILRWKKDYKIQLVNKEWVRVDVKEFLSEAYGFQFHDQATHDVLSPDISMVSSSSKVSGRFEEILRTSSVASREKEANKKGKR